MIRVATALGLTVLGLLIVVAGAWGAAALAVSGPASEAARLALAAAFGASALVASIGLWLRRWRWRLIGVFAGLFAIALAWYFSIEPSNDRDWVTENERLPWATVEGDAVTLHEIRDFEYRTETDFTPAYYDKRFELSKLQGVDLVATYWMGPAIAHIMLSFEFAGGDHVAISIETRKEKGEGYSTVKGFFRQYELYYVVADERDLIRLRTNYRKNPPEQVYVYRIKGSRGDGARRVFMSYIEAINELKTHPTFYNSLTTNCTTTIWMHSLVNPGHVPFSWKILASGYLPQYLYEHGRLEEYGLPFDELQRRSHVNQRAQQADQAPDFSRRIREPTP
ncbi:MAG TPA: DUF4105 domain-containing protein [Burkholderiaceae bacterium]|nr:DUF4105 domain-containing protein [Burkholderiaceae bacterium]